MEKCIYERTFSNIPYPRVEYKTSCGLLLVQLEGYKKHYEGYYENELYQPEEKCMKCKKDVEYSNI
jgi:hypothetical protein